MNNVQTKRRPVKQNDAPQSGKKTDSVFYVLALSALALSLFFVPQLLNQLGISLLSSGAGLNKLLSVIIAAGLGWLCLLPAQGYKNFIALAKGARTEWRKTVKPDRETVLRTTMMVLFLVFVFAILILILDWIFGAIVRGFIN